MCAPDDLCIPCKAAAALATLQAELDAARERETGLREKLELACDFLDPDYEPDASLLADFRAALSQGQAT